MAKALGEILYFFYQYCKNLFIFIDVNNFFIKEKKKRKLYLYPSIYII